MKMAIVKVFTKVSKREARMMLREDVETSVVIKMSDTANRG